MNTKDVLTTFIKSELVADQGLPSIDENDSLLENGIIDSLAIMKLLAFIEKEFMVKVSDEDLMPENFNTIASIARLIEKQNQDISAIK